MHKYIKLIDGIKEFISNKESFEVPNITGIRFLDKIIIGIRNTFSDSYKLFMDGEEIQAETVSGDNKIFYTTFDGNIIDKSNVADMTMTSNTYKDYGVMTFTGSVGTILSSAFPNCYPLRAIRNDNCTTIGSYAFYFCIALTSVSFPNCTTISDGAFMRCSSLTTVSFPNCTTIGNYAFKCCFSLTTIYLNSVTTVTSLPYSAAFSGCNALTSIYVPASLVQSFKSATNWTYFSDKIVAWNG